MPAIRLSALPALGVIWGVATSALPISGWVAQAADSGSARVGQSSGGESRNEGRATKPGAVSVHVFLLAENVTPNPEEYIEVGGNRYIYFNSPQLAAPARPLAEPRPRYPKGQMAQKDGAVMLQLLISERGELEQAIVVCAAPPFEKSATDSVKGIKFKPALGKDGPVKSYLLAEFGYGRGFPCAATPE